jgi:ribosomal protein S18 acetylase RimI-like enzyme
MPLWLKPQRGHIVAIASCGPLRDALAGFDGELYVLYVLKSFQGLGYGQRLVTRAAHDLASRGYHSLVAWVLKDNPARRFYERLGGRLAAEAEGCDATQNARP